MEARLNPFLARDLADILREPTPRDELVNEGPLIVAARMLSRAAESEMTATTVVGVLGCDDAHALRSLVQNIADEFGLEATIKLKVGSFSVRFSRPPEATAHGVSA
jgi:hypothetical protein